MLKLLWSRIRAAWPVNRVMTAITPWVTIVSAAASGWVVSWAAANMPGLPPIDPNWLAGIFTAGALAGAGAAVSAFRKWMDGHIQYEKLLADPSSRPLVKLPTQRQLGLIAYAALLKPENEQQEPPAE